MFYSIPCPCAPLLLHEPLFCSECDLEQTWPALWGITIGANVQEGTSAVSEVQRKMRETETDRSKEGQT